MAVEVSDQAGCEFGEALHLRTSLTGDAGPLTFAGDVTIDGDVRKDSRVVTGGSARIGGSVESASVSCGGELFVANGSISGGRTSAYRGVVCRTLGGAHGRPTEILIGFDEQLIELATTRLPEIEKAYQLAARFRKTLEPMLKDQKALSAEQKEQVCDLLCRAGEARKRAQVAGHALLARLADAEAGGRLEWTVTDTIFAGVTIKFPGAKVVFQTVTHGPLRIIATRTGRGITVDAIHSKTGKSQPLQRVPEADRVDSLRDALHKLEQV